jgi:hypothetical protein
MRSVESKLQGQKVNRNLDPKIWRCGHQDGDPYTEKNEIQRVRTSNRVKGEKSWVESVGKKSKKSIEREKKQMLPATFSSEKPAGHQIHKQAPSSCALINLVVIFTFVHGWANERESWGKRREFWRKGKVAYVGLLNAQASQTGAQATEFLRLAPRQLWQAAHGRQIFQGPNETNQYRQVFSPGILV